MFKNILVPIDLSNEASLRSVPLAIEFAQASGGRLTLLSVQMPVPAMAAQYLPSDIESRHESDAADHLNGVIASNKIGDIAVARVRRGTVYHEVLDEAKQMGADLIIMTSHHPELSDYLLGSNAANIVRHADCSVLVLRE